ncbi:DUF6265 family protein [Aureitalea marina]|uniref:DUF6265 domain-containing protein n=1 Tax=Aureitalea marina TaxID=930804 RepID=A0A2S7KRZ9_9FLAO|nr:DUF6265 family protein [Aureitalea marina]PQB05377.1 hypothetical protein BST85_11125 [Aureitalea marina]
MIKIPSFLLVILLLIPATGWAQHGFENTKVFDKSKASPKATLTDIDWIAGHWRGEAFGGITEEIWSPPLGNSMMCSFKLVMDGEVQFYEIVTISEVEETLVLKLKHFHGDLKGWEEKDETVNFKLVEIQENHVYFDEFTFERISDDEMIIYVVADIDGHKDEIAFPYKRFQ